MTLKIRPTNVDEGISGVALQYIEGGLVSDVRYQHKLRGIEQVLSTGHPWPPNRGRIKRYGHEDLGGSFELLRRTIVDSATYVNASYLYGVPSKPSGWIYNGRIFANTMNTVRGANDLPGTINGSIMLARGAQGWARYKPTQARGGVSQFLGELRELPTLPKLLGFKQTSNFFKDLGSDYLNVEFGWKPFLKDVHGFYKNVIHTDDILRQLARDNGKPVRRSGPIDMTTSKSSSRSTGYFTLPSLVSYLYKRGQEKIIEIEETEKFWFSGRFRYFIPTGNDPDSVARRKAQLARIVYGAEITPKLLYQLTPWSWLADWVSSLGAVIDNLSNDLNDSLVADYAYAMGQRSRIERHTVTGAFHGHGEFETSQTYIDLVKVRSKASPYGFGLTWDRFNPRQLAILASLGVTRVF